MIKTVDRVILFSLELNSFDKDCYRCQLLRMQSIVNDLVIDLWEMGSASSHCGQSTNAKNRKIPRIFLRARSKPFVHGVFEAC